MPTPIEIPQNLADLVSDPQRVRDAFELLNALALMEVHLVPPGGADALIAGNQPIRGEPPVLILPLPLQSPNSWAAATGTLTRITFETSTVTTAELAERVAALISDFKATRILP
jgi:hypothetical protein